MRFLLSTSESNSPVVITIKHELASGLASLRIELLAVVFIVAIVIGLIALPSYLGLRSLEAQHQARLRREERTH